LVDARNPRKNTYSGGLMTRPAAKQTRLIAGSLPMGEASILKESGTSVPTRPSRLIGYEDEVQTWPDRGYI
jgi:hypothetical protein